MYNCNKKDKKYNLLNTVYLFIDTSSKFTFGILRDQKPDKTPTLLLKLNFSDKIQEIFVTLYQ